MERINSATIQAIQRRHAAGQSRRSLAAEYGLSDAEVKRCIEHVFDESGARLRQYLRRQMQKVTENPNYQQRQKQRRVLVANFGDLMPEWEAI